MIPRNEIETVALFSKLAQELGYKFKSMGTGYPDAVMVKGGKDVRIEFEFKAKNFQAHGHDPKGADLVICWENDWPACPVPVLSLETYLTLVKPMSRWQRFLTWLRDYQVMVAQYARVVRSAKIENGKRLTCCLCGGKVTISCSYVENEDEKSDVRKFGSIIYRCATCGHLEIEHETIWWD